MPEQEEWRPVVGFPEYSISDSGRVVSHRTWHGQKNRVMRAAPCSNGYRLVHLVGPDGAKYSRLVHHLVAEAFIGPRPEGNVIRHLDGDRLNNRASNLTYGTASENAYDKVRHGRHHNAKKTHCHRGHPFNEANTWRSKTQRICATCATLRRGRVPAAERVA